MRLTELSDEELFELSKDKVKRGPTKGNATAEAKMAARLLRERHNLNWGGCGGKSLAAYGGNEV